MARTKHNQISDSSSEDEENEMIQQKSTNQFDDDDLEEEEENSEEEDDDETPPVTPEKKMLTPKPISTVAPPRTQSLSESDSETDSAEDGVTLRFPSKQAVNSSNVARINKPSSTPVKRPSETQIGGTSKAKKGRVSNGDEEEKKFAITRLWSEKDEIALLQGMIDYQSKKGIDPYSELSAFGEFIKGLVHVEVSKNQLADKIRRLKKKYLNNAGKGENGEDPVFSRPHEYQSFDLSKKIWGTGNSSSEKMIEKVENFEEFWSMYPHLNESLNLEKCDGGKKFMKDNMCLIGSKRARELDKKWKDLFVDEVELYSKRLELIEEEIKLVMNAIKSSKS